MKVTALGIDLAKNVFQIHGIDQHGKVMLKKQLKRAQMAPFFINLPPCLVGIEACGSAHHWARKLQAIVGESGPKWGLSGSREHQIPIPFGIVCRSGLSLRKGKRSWSQFTV